MRPVEAGRGFRLASDAGGDDPQPVAVQGLSEKVAVESGRQLDWRAFINKLVYCYGCGRFGLPERGKTRPRNWTLLYQPHPEGPPGLHACSNACADDVREAMSHGPVVKPLKMATNITMSSEMREQMMAEAVEFASLEQGRLNELFEEATEVEVLPRNMHEPAIEVTHAELTRTNEETAYKSKCVREGCDGVLLMIRDAESLKLSRDDRCIACGQPYRYVDESVNGEPFHET